MMACALRMAPSFELRERVLRLGTVDGPWVCKNDASGPHLPRLHPSPRGKRCLHPHAVATPIWTNGNRVLAEKPSPEMLAEDDTRCTHLAADGVAALRRETFHPCHGPSLRPAIRDLLGAEADARDIPAVIGILRHSLPALSVRDQFRDTGVPTFLINGRLGGRFQPVRDLALRLLPSLEVVDLPGGLAINVERADLFVSSAMAFLERHANGS